MTINSFDLFPFILTDFLIWKSIITNKIFHDWLNDCSLKLIFLMAKNILHSFILYYVSTQKMSRLFLKLKWCRYKYFFDLFHSNKFLLKFRWVWSLQFTWKIFFHFIHRYVMCNHFELYQLSQMLNFMLVNFSAFFSLLGPFFIRSSWLSVGAFINSVTLELFVYCDKRQIFV